MKRFLKKVATTALAAALVLPAGLAGAVPMFPDVNSKTVTPDVQEAIESLASQGIIKGFPDGTFGPNKAITRAQFAKILAQIEGLQPNPAAAAHFTDVKDPEQQGWVGALYAAGLTTGTTATTYSPNKPIQRDQAVSFLVRALELTDVANELDLTPITTDGARINASHKANVGLLEKVGLIKGYPDGSFGPGDAFKRQQAANLLYKVQQNGDEYVNAAKALVNKVEVTQNEDGTLTIKAEVNGAAKADVAVTQTVNNQTSALYEQKGIQANEKGAIDVKIDKRFVAPGTYIVTVTAYNAEGAEIAKLTKDFKVGEGEVKGYTEAPDLVRVYSEGKYVYFVFDEEIEKIEDEHAFFIVRYDGDIIHSSEADLEDDMVTVKASFSSTDVTLSTLAGVERDAVSDEDRNGSIESVLPLNNVKIGGTTHGPDLKSVKIDSFKLEDDDAKEAIEVEYVFDEEIDGVIGDTYAHKFLLFLKDGTKLTGTNVKKEGKDTITVTFDVYWDGTTVTSGDGTQTSTVARKYGGVIDRDNVAVATVLSGAVTDGKNPNPLTAVDARTKASANSLRSAVIDFANGTITFTFNDNVEDVIDETDVQNHFNLVSLVGKTTTIGELGVAASDIDIDGKKVIVELNGNNLDHSQALIWVVAVAVGDILNSDVENERIVPGTVVIERTFSAGETYGPVLKSIDSEYDASDEILTVAFRFSIDIDVTTNAKDHFKLYNAEGEEVEADVVIDDIKDNEVIVEFEIEEADYEEVVAVAVEQGAVLAADDFKVGSESSPEFLINPAAHIPLNK
jgi:hypothetical protein